jgi:eukaryotic-like serine/threonine-protein kinase
MTPYRWRQIEQLYDAARKCAPGDRAALLEHTDPDIRARVERMLEIESGSEILGQSLADFLADPTKTVLARGAQLGPYKIEAQIGAGGMGTVYRAVDTRLGRVVAIKIAAARYSERFQLEARAIATVNHPNVCTLYDVGPNYLVMEFIEGSTLAAEIKRGPLAPTTAARYGAQIAAALAEAHALGIVHRDLKPANIMLTRHGVKVLDFGLARMLSITGITETNAILGTPAYMSPEQIEGREPTSGTDLFALGLVLYEIFTGRLPFPGDSLGRMLSSGAHPPLPALSRDRSGVPADLDPLVARLLEKDPATRPRSAAEVASELSSIADGLRREESMNPARIDTLPRAPALTASAANASRLTPSIAVLPFANIGADKDSEYFGDGLAEELITALARTPGVLVAGRTSSFFFRGKSVDVREIGARLRVEHILEGSVRRAGNRIRVTAQLMKVADGFYLWSERYDREMTDIFAIQDEITRSIVGALRVRLAAPAATTRRHTPSLRAYQAFLEGRQYLLVRPSPASLAQGKELLERAIQLDPEFAPPYSLLGVYYTRQASAGALATRDALRLARAAEQGALGVDPRLSEAHGMLAVCAGIDYNWAEADEHWRLALADEPAPPDVLFWYGNHYLMPIGRAAEAVDVESGVLERDPMNLLYRQLFAIALPHARRDAEAEQELRKILEVDGDSPALGTLGLLYAQQGRWDEARPLTEHAYGLAPQSSLLAGQLAALLARSGDELRAGALVEKLMAGQQCDASVGMAVFHALCGQFDQAADWVGRAIEERYPLLIARIRPLMATTEHWPRLAKQMSLPAT